MVVLSITTVSLAEAEKWGDVAATPKEFFEVFLQLALNKRDGTKKRAKIGRGVGKVPATGSGQAASTSSGRAASTGSGQAIKRMISDDVAPDGAGNYFEGGFSTTISRRWRWDREFGGSGTNTCALENGGGSVVEG
jgi:hypothetical protein